MTLKLSKLDPIYRGLVELDGNPPFKFGAKLNWNKARNLDTLGNRIELIQKERNKIIKPLLTPGSSEIPKEKLTEFMLQWADLMDVEEEIHLLNLDPDALNLFDPQSNPDGNLIPATVLEKLMPLFDGKAPS